MSTTHALGTTPVILFGHHAGERVSVEAVHADGTVDVWHAETDTMLYHVHPAGLQA